MKINYDDMDKRLLPGGPVTNSGFWDVNGDRVKSGTWHPTHFAYVDGSVKDGKYYQWLVVGPQAEVTIGGRIISLKPVLAGHSPSGMVDLEKPCVARKIHKVRLTQ
jgi:hypothetical protein